METANLHHTVLIVEDEPLIRMSSAVTLEEAGFHILEAGSGAEALDILMAHTDIDVLMTDVCMPGEITGLDLVALAHRFHPDIRSIVVSGNTSAEEASDAGAVGFLPKPYMAHSLVRAINNLIPRNLAPLGRAA
jgi:DNA-binding NtrC family response regulator